MKIELIKHLNDIKEGFKEIYHTIHFEVQRYLYHNKDNKEWLTLEELETKSIIKKRRFITNSNKIKEIFKKVLKAFKKTEYPKIVEVKGNEK